MKERSNWKFASDLTQGGSARHQFFFKGVPARSMSLTSPLAKQLAGYVLIERDLRMVRQWLDRINDFPKPKRTRNVPGWHPTERNDADHNLCLGLFVASLTFYGKCFAQCEGRRIKLNDDWIPKGFEDTHSLVLRMRNNFAAHSGADKFEDVDIVLALPVKRGSLRDKPRLYRMLRQMEVMLDLEDDEFSFIKLAAELREKVVKKTEELNDKIFDEIRPPAGWHHWDTKTGSSL